jgi:hypothetical protein
MRSRIQEPELGVAGVTGVHSGVAEWIEVRSGGSLAVSKAEFSEL